MLELLAVPFLACLVLTAMHVPLGMHVLARGIIFVDLALAQLAALGIAIAMLAGHPPHSAAAYWYALAFTMGGAVFFTLSRGRRNTVPLEAIIGIVYAASAAAAILVLDRSPQGAESIKQLLVGSILTVTPADVRALAILYAALGVLHWLARRPLLAISQDPQAARAQGRAVVWWDLFFYATFGLVVTSSVRVAGVLLVFSYLVVPATMSAMLVASHKARLFVGWAIGAAVSALGLWASGFWDLPTGAAVVTAFGVASGAAALLVGLRAFVAYAQANRRRAVATSSIALGLVVAVAGLLLVLFPRMDHPWLDATEYRWPALRVVFLNADDAASYREAQAASDVGTAELQRLRALQQDVQWGRHSMSDARQERLRQYLASRGEIVNGDRLLMTSLKFRARERQRWLLGMPMTLAAIAGIIGALCLRRRAPRDSAPDAVQMSMP